MKLKLLLGDCLEQLKTLPDNSVDSVVTDPPAGISFMGKEWDSDKGGRDHWIKWLSEIMVEVKRVLKPGGHCLVWGLPRTSHWTATAIEDAGFEIRDVINHIFGTGFPKSLNIGIGVDKYLGNERENIPNPYAKSGPPRSEKTITKMSDSKGRNEFNTKGTSEWEGWGTGLKPATEHWILARKPLEEKTVVQNVLKYGTGGINIDKSRIETEDDLKRVSTKLGKRFANYNIENSKGKPYIIENPNEQGRFPSNIILDDFTGKIVDEQSGFSKSVKLPIKDYKETNKIFVKPKTIRSNIYEDEGGASRFFYCSKPSGKEKNDGLENFEEKRTKGRDEGQDIMNTQFKKRPTPTKNIHPTVKSKRLMKYLINLITPPSGIVLDPFMGSGSTGVAAIEEGFGFIGIELNPEYFEIASARINNNLQK